MDCRPGCAACCIAPSISSPLPKLPAGKPAGVPCPHLLPDLRCELFGRPERPAVCSSLRPHPEMCGTTRDEALAYLAQLEAATGG
jgi:Fe-S-cluster containining protein